MEKFLSHSISDETADDCKDSNENYMLSKKKVSLRQCLPYCAKNKASPNHQRSI